MAIPSPKNRPRFDRRLTCSIFALPDIVYHITRTSALDVSIVNAVTLGYRYLDTYTFNDSENVIAIYHKLNATKKPRYIHAVKNGQYQPYIKELFANGVIHVQGIPF